MFEVRNAQPEDIDAAVAVLGEAFGQDPLMVYLFNEYELGARAGATQFFSFLLRARLALGMPAYVLQQTGSVSGAAMGYDTARPPWPPALVSEWREFERGIPGFTRRLAAYEKICEAYQPSENHYYLGVIGVHPSLQGNGAGQAMLDTFCALSRADTQSRGVYLDTSNPRSLQFYFNNGFELRGEGSLDGASLWCVYKRT